MVEKSLIEAAHTYIESRLLQTRRKFELVYSSTSDLNKKGQILNTIKDVERDMKKLQAGMFNADDLKRYSIEVEDLQHNRKDAYYTKDNSGYKILRNIQIISINKFSTNYEINSIYSYLGFFEREYLGLLSEQNLKLDYGHAYQRDKFFTSFNELYRFIEKYGELLEQIDSATSKDYKERLISIQSKQYRDVIMKTGKFLRTLENFVNDIVESEENGERVLMEPDKEVEINGEISTLNGVTSKEGLMDLFVYVEEFIDYLKIPEIKKIEEEE